MASAGIRIILNRRWRKTGKSGWNSKRSEFVRKNSVAGQGNGFRKEGTNRLGSMGIPGQAQDRAGLYGTGRVVLL